MSATTVEEVRAEVEAWLDENWDENLTVGQWWARLGPSGYAHPSLPENAYGKALMRAVDETLRVTGADGFYCDEFAWATRRLAYDTEWDGCTVAINPKTHAVGRRSSSVSSSAAPVSTTLRRSEPPSTASRQIRAWASPISSTAISSRWPRVIAHSTAICSITDSG